MNKKEEAYLYGLKVKALVDAIYTPEKPTEEKIGYRWVLKYTVGVSSFYWVQEEIPNFIGSLKNPIMWLYGEENFVVPKYYYTDGVYKYLCIKEGFPKYLGDTEYFTTETEE